MHAHRVDYYFCWLKFWARPSASPPEVKGAAKVKLAASAKWFSPAGCLPKSAMMPPPELKRKHSPVLYHLGLQPTKRAKVDREEDTAVEEDTPVKDTEPRLCSARRRKPRRSRTSRSARRRSPWLRSAQLRSARLRIARLRSARLGSARRTHAGRLTTTGCVRAAAI